MSEDNPPSKEDEDTPSGSQHSGVRRLHSAHSSGMDSSVFRFKNVNFTVGKGENEKYILQDISAKIKWGRKFFLNASSYPLLSTNLVLTFPSNERHRCLGHYGTFR